MDAPLEPFPEDWERALAVVAHPDDMEYGAASAVARWTASGKQVAYVLVTDGEAGIEGLPPEEAGPLRRREQEAGCAVVGVEEVEFLGMPDGTLTEGIDLRRAIAGAIRRHRPEVLLSINHRDDWGGPGWNHSDHRAVGRALLDAARDAANPWVFDDIGPAAHSGVRFAAFGGSPRPTHGVDVGGQLASGIASLREHRAYLEHLGGDMADPSRFLTDLARRSGELLGVEFGATFEIVPL